MELMLSNEQVSDVKAALVYYMRRHISITNPRYTEYESILQLLTKSKEKTK